MVAAARRETETLERRRDGIVAQLAQFREVMTVFGAGSGDEPAEAETQAVHTAPSPRSAEESAAEAETQVMPAARGPQPG
jgi:hypothetical protein